LDSGGTSLQSIEVPFESSLSGWRSRGLMGRSRSWAPIVDDSMTVFLSSIARSGSLVFPASSMILACHQADLRGVPHVAAISIRCRHRHEFRPSTPSSPLQSSRWSWDCRRTIGRSYFSSPSSRGIHPTLLRRLAPPSTSPRASTPRSDVAIGSFGDERPARQSRSVLAVSHRHDGFRRTKLAGLLHPATDPEVRRVSRSKPFPATHPPLEEFRSPPAVPRHRGLCPLEVPLPRSRAPCRRPLRVDRKSNPRVPISLRCQNESFVEELTETPPSRLCSTDEPVAIAYRCRPRHRSILPGLPPLRDLFLRGRTEVGTNEATRACSNTDPRIPPSVALNPCESIAPPKSVRAKVATVARRGPP